MLTISGIVSAVSVLVVLVVSAVLIRQKYDLQNEYTYRIDDLTKQINDVNATNAKLEIQQQTHISGAQQNIGDLRANYVRKDDLGKNTTTQVLNAQTATFATASSAKGFQVTNDNPGALVEKVYGGNQGDRYGVGNVDGSAKLYASSANKDARVQLSFANPDGSFQDAVTLQRKSDKESKMNLDGELILNNKFSVNGYGDEVIRIMDKDNKGLFGGLEMNTLNVANTAKMNVSTVTQKLTIAGAPSPYNVNGDSTVFNNDDSKNHIRGDTNIYGNTSNLGDLNVGSKLSFGQPQSLFMQGNESGVSVNFLAPAGAQQWITDGDVVHQLDSAGHATHRSLKLANNTDKNNIVFEAGRTMDGENEGMSSINFGDETKTQWRMSVDQTGSRDKMFFDQTKKDGSKNTYMTFNNNNVGIGGTTGANSKLHVQGGAFTQRQSGKSPTWKISSEGGDDGIIGYDGASFGFARKGTKMISVNADGKIDLNGNVDIAKDANIAGVVNTKNVWLDDSIGFGKTSAGSIAVMDKQKQLKSLEVHDFSAASSKVGQAGLEVQGNIASRSGLNIDKFAHVKGDLTVDGTTTLNGAFNISNGSYMMDAQGNVVVRPMDDKNLTLGADNTDNIILGPGEKGEIKIGKRGAFYAGKDGNTSVRAYKPGQNVFIGDDKPRTVVIGEQASENYMGTKARLNMIGKSQFPAYDGNIYINPTAPKKNIYIGTDADSSVANINIGREGSVISVGGDKFCMQDACVVKGDINNIKEIPGIIGKPAMGLTADDIMNVKKTIPGLAAAPVTSLNSGDVENVKKIPGLLKAPAITLNNDNVVNLQALNKDDVANLKALPKKPALGLIDNDVVNIKAIPKIFSSMYADMQSYPSTKLTKDNVDVLAKITAEDVKNIKAIASIAGSAGLQLSAQDVANVRKIPSITDSAVMQLNTQDVANFKASLARPAMAFTANDVAGLKASLTLPARLLSSQDVVNVQSLQSAPAPYSQSLGGPVSFSGPAPAGA